MKCKYCGNELSGSEKFCSSCGAPTFGTLQDNSEKEAFSQQITNGQTELKPKKSKIRFPKIIIVVIVLFVGCGVLFGKSDNSENNLSKNETPSSIAATETTAEIAKTETPSATVEQQKEVSVEEKMDNAPNEEHADSTVTSYEFHDSKELFESLKNNALRAKNDYYQKDVEICGVFASVDNDGKYFTLKADNEDFSEYSFDGIHCTMKTEKVRNQVMEINKGETIYVSGKITDVGEVLGYYLEADSVSRNPSAYSSESASVENNTIQVMDSVDNNDYILPQSATSYLKIGDVDWMDDATLRLAVNVIFARHGRRFNSQDLQEYFDSQPWYHGTIAPEDFNEQVFNSYEKENARLISELQEKRKNGSSGDSDAVTYYYQSTTIAGGQTVNDNLEPVTLRVNEDGTATFTGFGHVGVLPKDDEYYYAGWVDGEMYVMVAKFGITIEEGDCAYYFER